MLGFPAGAGSGHGIGCGSTRFAAGAAGRRRRGRHAELALQFAEFVVLHIEQAMRVRELLLQILNAILERGASPLESNCRRYCWCRRPRPESRGVGGRRMQRRFAAPCIHLTMHFADSFGLIQRRYLIGARDAQYRATAQNVDVAAERFGIRAIHRNHGLIDVEAGIGMQAACNLGQRIALDDTIAASAEGQPASVLCVERLGRERGAARARWPRGGRRIRAEGPGNGRQPASPRWCSTGVAVTGEGCVGPAGAPAPSGAATGAALLAGSPGVYTGGSSNTVYSRIRRPRAQFTSTKNVTNGSGMASVERTSKTSRPSLLLPT